MPDWLNFPDDTFSLLNLVAAAAAVFAVLSSLVAGWSNQLVKKAEAINKASARLTQDVKFDKADYGKNLKEQALLPQALLSLKSQRSIATRNQWMSRSLTFSQYVVAGLLTSSFIQQSLSSNTIGLFGLIVLASQIIHHQYRPDVVYRRAFERAVKLKILIREAEDEIFAIESQRPQPPSIHRIRERVSKGLSEVETQELRDVNIDVSELEDT